MWLPQRGSSARTRPCLAEFGARVSSPCRATALLRSCGSLSQGSAQGSPGMAWPEAEPVTTIRGSCVAVTVCPKPKSIDTLAAAGVLMADIWKDQHIVTIDMLGDEFLETVQMGDPVSFHEDGTVEVG